MEYAGYIFTGKSDNMMYLDYPNLESSKSKRKQKMAILFIGILFWKNF